MEKIILISGKAENGKSEVAKIIKEELALQSNKCVVMRKRCVVMHFAKYLKQYLVDYFGWDGVSKTEYFRKLLQYLGTDKIRLKLNKPLFHAKRINEDMEVLADDFDVFLIDDARFKNELYYTYSQFPNCTIDIRVDRPFYESKLTEEQKNHISETDSDDFRFKYRVTNMDLEDLRNQIREILIKEELLIG